MSDETNNLSTFERNQQREHSQETVLKKLSPNAVSSFLVNAYKQQAESPNPKTAEFLQKNRPHNAVKEVTEFLTNSKGMFARAVSAIQEAESLDDDNRKDQIYANTTLKLISEIEESGCMVIPVTIPDDDPNKKVNPGRLEVIKEEGDKKWAITIDQVVWDNPGFRLIQELFHEYSAYCFISPKGKQPDIKLKDELLFIGDLSQANYIDLCLVELVQTTS